MRRKWKSTGGKIWLRKSYHQKHLSGWTGTDRSDSMPAAHWSTGSHIRMRTVNPSVSQWQARMSRNAMREQMPSESWCRRRGGGWISRIRSWPFLKKGSDLISKWITLVNQHITVIWLFYRSSRRALLEAFQLSNWQRIRSSDSLLLWKVIQTTQ